MKRRALVLGVAAVTLAACTPAARPAAPGRSHGGASRRRRRPHEAEGAVPPTPPADGTPADGTQADGTQADAPRGDGRPAGAAAEPPPPVLDLPPRAPGAETGSQLLERTDGLGREAFDDEAVAAILAGNVPDHLRRLVPLTVEEGGVRAVLHVACDYLAVGSDEDFVRIPMTSAAAQRIADRLGASLPTTKLVDAIYRAATVRLPPCWIDGGPSAAGTIADTARHHAMLEERRRRVTEPLGVLVAGHKKDIVLSTRMEEDEGRVAIYGWHKAEDAVVQPLSMRHSCRYADYSHGVRLVDQRVVIDGVVHRMSDVLRDAELAPLVSAEGPLSIVAYPTVLPSYEAATRRRRPG